MGKQHNRRIFAGFYKRYDGNSSTLSLSSLM